METSVFEYIVAGLVVAGFLFFVYKRVTRKKKTYVYDPNNPPEPMPPGTRPGKDIDTNIP
jgi:hypothetical protein